MCQNAEALRPSAPTGNRPARHSHSPTYGHRHAAGRRLPGRLIHGQNACRDRLVRAQLNRFQQIMELALTLMESSRKERGSIVMELPLRVIKVPRRALLELVEILLFHEFESRRNGVFDLQILFLARSTNGEADFHDLGALERLLDRLLPIYNMSATVF